MKILLKKEGKIEKYTVYLDGKKTNLTVDRDKFGTTPYYLIWQGKRLRGRFPNKEEVSVWLKVYFLEKEADRILK